MYSNYFRAKADKNPYNTNANQVSKVSLLSFALLALVSRKVGNAFCLHFEKSVERYLLFMHSFT